MQRVCHAKKNQNASKRGTIETSSLRFARSKPQKIRKIRRSQKQEIVHGDKGAGDKHSALSQSTIARRKRQNWLFLNTTWTTSVQNLSLTFFGPHQLAIISKNLLVIRKTNFASWHHSNTAIRSLSFACPQTHTNLEGIGGNLKNLKNCSNTWRPFYHWIDEEVTITTINQIR